MIKNEIIDMAKEAGCVIRNGHIYSKEIGCLDQMLKRFTELIAAREREQGLKIMQDMISSAVAVEREVCAQTAENCTNIYHDTPKHIANLLRKGIEEKNKVLNFSLLKELEDATENEKILKKINYHLTKEKELLEKIDKINKKIEALEKRNILIENLLKE